MTNVPRPFDGPMDEALDNFATHQWGGIDGRCYTCDAKPTHRAAYYPCGATVPRMVLLNPTTLYDIRNRDNVVVHTRIYGREAQEITNMNEGFTAHESRG